MEEIAGYRVVRVVRDEGERRVVAAFGDDAVELHVGVGSAAAGIAREAEVLLGVAHPHLLPVLDVASIDDAVVLVRPASASTVADWLVVRAAPHAGEVVTVAAPVLAAVAALHAHGAVAGRIHLRSIVLDDDGAPALVGVDARRETDRATDAWRAASAGVVADCVALLALVADLVAAAGARMPDDVRAALERHDVAHASHALLAAWSALPIEHVRHEPAPPRRGRERVRVDDGATLAVRIAQTALAHASTVRRPVWIAAGAGALALVVAIAIGGAGASSAADPSPISSASPTAPEPVATTPPAPEVAAVDATAALLAARERCLDADDDACLDGIVDASGGAAAATWRMPADATLAESAVLGDAVLIDVASDSEPASVLVVRTDAGWMLRDLWSD